MGALADRWTCDASNATWIVDRRERQGLAERRGSPTDRRVKLVVLPRRGVRVGKLLHQEMMRPPAVAMKMELGELTALRDSLARLTEVSDLLDGPPPQHRC